MGGGSLRRWLLVLYAAVVVFATWQRAGPRREHTTFPIFRQSYAHLAAHQDLYAAYPAEQGASVEDRFKYSPSAAVLFAPLRIAPFSLALLAWNLLNAGLLVLAISSALPPNRANLALLLLAPEVLCALQSSSSNALVAALLIFAALAHDTGRMFRGGFLIAVGTAVKLFPVAGVVFVVMHADRRRAVAAMIAAGVVVFALPLLLLSPHELLRQYRSWGLLELSDTRDVLFGMSLMRQIRQVSSFGWPNWVLQVAGTIVFLLPLALRPDRWASAEFRFHYLCSMLIYVVLFNHQAERQSFIIAATGAVLWFANGQRTVERGVIVALALVGIPTWPYLALWLMIHLELLAEAHQRVGAVPIHAPLEAERLVGRRERQFRYPRAVGTSF